jgi:glycosyltransferase involved in cell wall biosynthesis
MAQQTVKPLSWFIIDDGSSDRTPEFAQRFADQHPFIKLIRNAKRSPRQTGVAEVLAFNTGYALARELDYDCIVKLDGDLAFGADYFERLLARFKDNPKLGIASGVYLELHDGKWIEIPMPSYHACGASKVIRKPCFEAIGGFVAQRGWDTVDEIKAMALGWETTHFADAKMEHLKPEGTGMGMLRTTFMHGEIYYRTRGGFVFFVLKVLRRHTRPPYLTGGLWMFWGWLNAVVRRKERLVTAEEGRCYRALLNARLFGKSN